MMMQLCSSPLVAAGRSLMASYLRGMKKHTLVVSEKGLHDMVFGNTGDGNLTATIKIRNSANFFSLLLLETDIGFAKAYISGDMETDDLADLLSVLLENRNHVGNYVSWTSYFTDKINYAWHYIYRAPRNQAMSQQNVSEHYDLTGLFHHFLDPTMSYSSGIFLDPADTMEQASLNKIASTIDQLKLSAGQRVLEIGSGWGSLAFAMAEQSGVTVHGLTLSQEQLDYCEEKCRERGLTDRVTFELVDYRNHTSTIQYDRIVSIEMLEAVGHPFLSAFFAVCDRLLVPSGLLFVQVITMSDERYETYRSRPDFINTLIFPGGSCPSLTALTQAATKGSSLQVETVANIGTSYARTLHIWADNFKKAWPKIQAENLQTSKDSKHVNTTKFSDEFLRKWFYYFKYCEVAFATRTIGDLQILWTRSTNTTSLGGVLAK